ncbi:hypothetical protein CHS0354_002174 [Potamilus streckersoni]|uniref:Uncharacterized protein n=1 Tax=Potamilus streckersoni TaxID=2493646 RepID=A0AAE0RRX1_9BIVA|nr:hypothetical protein CHS0354_002174 [Potamilus streckersoni]
MKLVAATKGRYDPGFAKVMFTQIVCTSDRIFDDLKVKKTYHISDHYGVMVTFVDNTNMEDDDTNKQSPETNRYSPTSSVKKLSHNKV